MKPPSGIEIWTVYHYMLATLPSSKRQDFIECVKSDGLHNHSKVWETIIDFGFDELDEYRMNRDMMVVTRG